MTDDDLWLPTPTVMDATRHTVRGCWRPGENWRGVSLNNAIMDAGEVIAAGTHTIHLSDEVTCLPTPTSDRWNGGTMRPARRAAMGHAVTCADWAEKSDDIRLLPTPDCMDAIMPRSSTGDLRRWIGANAADPTLFEPYWLARHAPFDAHPKARLDQPMRDRMLARWRETDRGMSLIDPMFWPGCKDMDPDIPIPATRLPDKSVLDYWKTRSVGSRFPSAAHLSPRFVEWMMGLEDGWVTNPAIWRHVDGNHRNLQLRALGNGVVPPQAAMAVDWALRVRERLAV